MESKVREVGTQENITLIVNEEVVFNLNDAKEAKGLGLVYAVLQENEDGVETDLGVLECNYGMMNAVIVALVKTQFHAFSQETGPHPFVAGAVYAERLAKIVSSAMSDVVE